MKPLSFQHIYFPFSFQWWHAVHACAHKQKELFMFPLAHAHVLATRRSLPLFLEKPSGMQRLAHLQNLIDAVFSDLASP
jgi:hypothetical protein